MASLIKRSIVLLAACATSLSLMTAALAVLPASQPESVADTENVLSGKEGQVLCVSVPDEPQYMSGISYSECRKAVKAPKCESLKPEIEYITTNDSMTDNTVTDSGGLEQTTTANPYAGIHLTDSEKIYLAKVIYSEANAEPFEGQVAVALVALNRCLHSAFPDNIYDVLLSPYQFAHGYTYTQTQLDAVEAALAGSDALDLNTDVVFFSTGALRYGSYYKTICCHVFRTYK